MDMSTSYNLSSNVSTSVPTSASSGAEGSSGAGAAGQGARFDGNTALKGEIVDMSKDSVTIRLPEGDTVKGNLESFPDAKIGDTVKFTATTNQNGEHTFSIMSKTAEQAKNAMVLNALKAANLKPTADNLMLVNSLLENNLPIDKASITSLSNVMKFSGASELPKALFLLKNSITPTLPTMERLNEYINNNIKLSGQIENLAKSIMEMPEGAEKNKLLELFSEILSEAEGTTQSGTGKPAVAGEAALGEAGETADPSKAAQEQGKPTVEGGQIPAQAGESAATASTESLLQQIKNTNLGTEFSRAIFDSVQNAAQHMEEHPLPADAAKFAEANLMELKEGLSNLLKEGNMTKETAESLISSIPGGKDILAGIKDEDTLKSLLLKVSKDSETLDENVKNAETAKKLINSGAKKIAQRLSFSLDGGISEEGLDKVFDKLKEKLTQISSTLDNGKDADGIRKNLDDIKENLKFVDRFKNDPYLQIPLAINESQKQADLFVFSGKHGKNKKRLSQSALISLDLANLGHFETYVRRDDRSIACQFRLAEDEVSDLVKEHIDKLDTLLRDKGYKLDNISFVQIDEKFTLSDDEPNEEIDNTTPEERLGRFSFDSRV